MRIFLNLTTMVYLGTIMLLNLFASNSVASPKLDHQFDSLGPTVRQLTLKNGREIHYVDDGEKTWTPVVFIGGLGTSVRAIRLLDFLRTMRRDLKIRLITVERNGFGQTAFDPSLTMTDYSTDVEKVLAHLRIDRFSLFGISGGGPYAAKIAARNADRIVSIHMAATSPMGGNPDRCQGDQPASSFSDLLKYPMLFFGFAKDSSLHLVEGLQDTAYDEAARAHNIRGQSADPTPLLHELDLYCKEGVIDSTDVKSKVFVYRGLADSILGDENLDVWKQAYPSASLILRTYPNEGHEVQYRHLDQILLDIAGFGDKVLVCQGEAQNRQPKLVAGHEVQRMLTRNGRLGICSW